MKKLNKDNKNPEQNRETKSHPYIRFKSLTLELESGQKFVIPGLQLHSVEIEQPIVSRSWPHDPMGFIERVGPQEVTIKFSAYGIPWPKPSRDYEPDRPKEISTEKPLRLPPSSLQLPEHKDE